MMPKAPHANCPACPYKDNRRIVFGYGSQDAELVLVGEAPGMDELITGKPFTGASGQLLDAVLKAVGTEPNQTYRTNAVLCRPPSNEKISDVAITCCRPRLLAEIEQLPGTVVALGASAAKALGSPKGILSIQGRWAQASYLGGREYMPTVHPAFVLRNPPACRDLLDGLEKARTTREVLPPFEPNVVDTMPPQMWIADEAVFDVETGADGSLLCINICWGPTLNDTCVLVPPFKDAFFDKEGMEYIAHNGKFDVKVLRVHGIKARCDFDTMLAHHILDERKAGANEFGQFQRGVHGLKILAGKYFDAPDYDEEITRWAKARANKSDLVNYDMRRVPKGLLYKYGVLDAWYTWRLKQIFEMQLLAAGIYQWPFKQLVMQASEAFTQAEMRGFAIDVTRLQAVDVDWNEELENIHDDLAAYVHHDFNPGSPTQVADELFITLGLPRPAVRKQIGTSLKGGNDNTTDKTVLLNLLNLQPKHHEFIHLLLKHRRLVKLHGSYIKAIQRHLGSDSRLRTNVKLHGTEVGRTSTEEPSLQNLPRPDEKEEGHYGKAIRDLFVAGPGMVLISVDLSQAELRCAAALSGDPVLSAAFQDGRDPHDYVAKQVFGGGGEEERYVAKAINFGVLYGGKRKTLVARVMDLRGFRVTMTANVAAVDKIVGDYMTTMKRFFEWREEMWQQAKHDGYVSSRTGRRRRFMLVNDTNEDEIRKAAVHAPTAGLAADIITMAFSECTTAGVQTLLTVHDQILAECRPDEVKSVAAFVTDTIMRIWDRWIPEVPGAADTKIGARWGSLHKIK